MSLGPIEAGQLALMVVLMASSLLSRGYLMPVVARGFFRPPPDDCHGDQGNGGNPGIHEAPLLCVIPPVLTGIGCVLLFFSADDVWNLLTGML